jgi:hypothetical protein
MVLLCYVVDLTVTYFPFAAPQSDSEYMSGQLSAFGYAITEEPEGADLWLINTYDPFILFAYCSLKARVIHEMDSLIRNLKLLWLWIHSIEHHLFSCTLPFSGLYCLSG